MTSDSKRYRTIVADPPWRYRTSLPTFMGAPNNTRPERWKDKRSVVPYATMELDEIRALPVVELAEKDAHLYLWTTNTHLKDAWSVASAWGFAYSTLLVWAKPPRGGGGGFPTYACCTEYVLFCRRGSLKAVSRSDRNWWEWPRAAHSVKPEAFLDLVERVSPGPYLELFARRNRFGWDTWGNEAFEHVSVSSKETTASHTSEGREG